VLLGKDFLEGSSAAVLPRYRPRNPPKKLRDLLRRELIAISSPYHVQSQSESIGIFFDGTNNYLSDMTNIARLYNAYNGTKYYFGGVGNATEYRNWESRIPGGAFGYQFYPAQVRAKVDVAAHWREGHSVDIYGFSRGAAQGVEFARALEKGIYSPFYGRVVHPPVRVLGAFDPVYSVAFPGQPSTYVTNSVAGSQGNYVHASLPSNVETAIVFAAQHEQRTWFPATKLEVAKGSSTKLSIIATPGSHGDIGGHYESNPLTQRVTFSLMARLSREAGAPIKEASPLEGFLDEYLQNKLVQRAVERQEAAVETATGKNYFSQWKELAKVGWATLSDAEIRAEIDRADFRDWTPGPFGVQTAGRNPFRYAVGGILLDPTTVLGRGRADPLDPVLGPQEAMLPRDIRWATTQIGELVGADVNIVDYLKDARWSTKTGSMGFATPISVGEWDAATNAKYRPDVERVGSMLDLIAMRRAKPRAIARMPRKSGLLSAAQERVWNEEFERVLMEELLRARMEVQQEYNAGQIPITRDTPTEALQQFSR
jgi:hypothetical protein